MEDKKLEHFVKLFAINCNDKTEKKNNGSTELTYLSWTYAWGEVKKIYPDAQYEILKFGENNLPYTFDSRTGYMVFTKVTIEGIEHEMWLPVMNSANKAMKDVPYTYKAKQYNYQTKNYEIVDKLVEAATMFDINKTIMRCLTKNLAMFGLGLYIYSGEDLPENIETEKSEPRNTKKSSVTANGKEVMITENQKEIIKKTFSADEIKNYLFDIDKKKLSDLTLIEASDLIKAKKEEEK